MDIDLEVGNGGRNEENRFNKLSAFFISLHITIISIAFSRGESTHIIDFFIPLSISIIWLVCAYKSLVCLVLLAIGIGSWGNWKNEDGRLNWGRVKKTVLLCLQILVFSCILAIVVFNMYLLCHYHHPSNFFIPILTRVHLFLYLIGSFLWAVYLGLIPTVYYRVINSTFVLLITGSYAPPQSTQSTSSPKFSHLLKLGESPNRSALLLKVVGVDYRSALPASTSPASTSPLLLKGFGSRGRTQFFMEVIGDGAIRPAPLAELFEEVVGDEEEPVVKVAAGDEEEPVVKVATALLEEVAPTPCES